MAVEYVLRSHCFLDILAPLFNQHVAQGQTSRTVQLRWYQRLFFLVVGLGLISMLIVAWTLEPDPKGFGTHQKLGLPPCSFKQFFGVRCPSCGMTTSWSHFVRGQFIQALYANVGGTMLALVAALAGPWTAISAFVGRMIWKRPSDWFVVITAMVILTVTLVDWIVRYFIET